MADFSNINVSNTESEVIAAISGMIESALKVDPTSDTNIPVNSIRLVDVGAGAYRFQKYDGSVWADVAVDAITLDGNAPGDLGGTDVVAGTGLSFSGSTLNADIASQSVRGMTFLANPDNKTSNNLAATPINVRTITEGDIRTIAAVSTSFRAVVDTCYDLISSSSTQHVFLPQFPVDGSRNVFIVPRANHGALRFLASGSNHSIFTDRFVSALNPVTGTVDQLSGGDPTLPEDLSQSWEVDEFAGRRAVNTSQGDSISWINSNTSDRLNLGLSFGADSADWEVGDNFRIDDGAVEFPFGWDLIAVEFVFNSANNSWRCVPYGAGTRSKFLSKKTDGDSVSVAKIAFLPEPKTLQDYINNLETTLTYHLGYDDRRWSNSIQVTTASFSKFEWDNNYIWDGTADADFTVIEGGVLNKENQHTSRIINDSANGSRFDFVAGSGMTITLINGSRVSDGDKVRVPAGCYIDCKYKSETEFLIVTPFSAVVKVP